MALKILSVKDGSTVKKLVLAGLFAAFTTIATMLITVPAPTKGYINLGDCMVNVGAWLLGPFYGAAAAGIGSALADVFAGYTLYAPATLVIKGLMGAVSGLLFKALIKRNGALSSFSGTGGRSYHDNRVFSL